MCSEQKRTGCPTLQGGQGDGEDKEYRKVRGTRKIGSISRTESLGRTWGQRGSGVLGGQGV